MSEVKIIRDYLEPHEDTNRIEVARTKAANDRSIRVVLDAGTMEDGRSPWKWIRLRNGDLILGVYPRGETYFDVEEDASF